MSSKAVGLAARVSLLVSGELSLFCSRKISQPEEHSLESILNSLKSALRCTTARSEADAQRPRAETKKSELQESAPPPPRT